MKRIGGNLRVTVGISNEVKFLICVILTVAYSQLFLQQRRSISDNRKKRNKRLLLEACQQTRARAGGITSMNLPDDTNGPVQQQLGLENITYKEQVLEV